jgi:hypothetical protein
LEHASSFSPPVAPDTPTVHTRHATWLIWRHRSDDAPFAVLSSRCVVRSSSFRSLNHVHPVALNPKSLFRELPVHLTCPGSRPNDAIDPKLSSAVFRVNSSEGYWRRFRREVHDGDRVCGMAPARRSGSEMGAAGAESEGFDARPKFHFRPHERLGRYHSVIELRSRAGPVPYPMHCGWREPGSVADRACARSENQPRGGCPLWHTRSSARRRYPDIPP